MDEQYEFGFCPKCGAVMQNGVCRSCGYGSRTGDGRQESVRIQEDKAKKPSKNRALAITFSVVGIMSITAVIIFLILSARAVFQRMQPGRIPGYGGNDYGNGYFGYGNPYDDYFGEYPDDSYGSDDGGYEGYEPDEDDEYYEEITDVTSLDLSYGVLWQTLSLHPADPDDTCTYDCAYPVLTGEDTEKFSAMNKILEETGCKYKDSYKEYPSGVSSYGYVTYMDEEKISVVFKHSFYKKKTTLPRIEAVTFRLDTGEPVPREEMINVNAELVWQFRSRNTSQNGKVEFIDKLSDEELEEYLKDSEESVLFYTPVGLELGFNYEDGWVTVTLKNNTL